MTESYATVVSSHAIRAGREEEFDRWTDELQALGREAPGHGGSVRLGQTQGFQHLLFRFDSRANAEAWQAGDAFRRHVAAAKDFSVTLRQTETGDPVQFDLPSDAAASKPKRFVATWLAVFPVLLVLSTVVRLVLKDAPQPLQLLVSSLMLTATLQWVILPRLQRRTRFWLLQDGEGKLRN